MLRDRLALTEEGARSLRKGALVCALANLVLMFPVGVFYLVTGEFLAHWEDGAVPLPTLWPYLALIAVVLAAVFATQYWEYHATYSVVYQESARKRIGLAERLRVLPLSFFGKRDLADLTTVIMKDAADQERLFSHTMPQAFGTGISTVIVSYFGVWAALSSHPASPISSTRAHSIAVNFIAFFMLSSILFGCFLSYTHYNK